MNRFLKAALAAALASSLAAPALAAQSIHVDFDDNNSGFGAVWAGYFEATDTNADGWISYSEVTSFYSGGAGYGPLLSFGDFDFADDVWKANPSNLYWSQETTDHLWGYFDGVLPETTVTALAVPEPGSDAMLLAGLAGVAALARRRKLG